jgi:SAM-dependent methyltransferase
VARANVLLRNFSRFRVARGRAPPLNIDQSLFSGPAAYERFMGRWSRELATLLVRFADVRDRDTLLDVGCGTGSIAAAVASTPAARIVGLDPAAAYVGFARSRHDHERTHFMVGDGQQLPFDNGAFDRTLSLLAINFVPDPQKTVTEMTRVTRRGGVVAAAVWDYDDGMEMLRLFWDAVVAQHPDDAQKDERHMRLCRSGELAALWRSHGLRDVTETALTTTMAFASFDDYWNPFLEKQGPAGQYVAALPESDRETLRRALRRRLLDDRPDHPFTLSARAWAARGLVP